MSNNVSIRFADDVLNAVDDFLNKHPNANRSSFVRDACLNHLKIAGEDVAYVKVSGDNMQILRRIAAHLNMDHDQVINMILDKTFENMQGPDPFAQMDEK